MSPVKYSLANKIILEAFFCFALFFIYICFDRDNFLIGSGSILFIIGLITSYISYKKNHNYFCWFLIGISTGLFGLVAVILKSPINSQSESKNEISNKNFKMNMYEAIKSTLYLAAILFVSLIITLVTVAKIGSSDYGVGIWWYSASLVVCVLGLISAYFYKFYSQEKSAFGVLKIIIANSIGIIVVGHAITAINYSQLKLLLFLNEVL